MKIKLNRDWIKSLNSLIDYLLINLMLTFFRNYFYKKIRTFHYQIKEKLTSLFIILLKLYQRDSEED